MNVTESEAKIPQQNLLDHTVQLLLSVQKLNIDICTSSSDLSMLNISAEQGKLILELITKYGIDVKGDQALYSIKFDQERHNDVSETSIVSSFICPIRLCLKGCSKIIWQSPAPSSPF